MQRGWAVRAGAVVGVVGGLVATSLALDLLRALSGEGEAKAGASAAVAFDLPPAPPPKAAARAPADRPKRASASTAKAARSPGAALSSGLGGLDLGDLRDAGGMDDATAATVGGAKAAVMTEDAVDDPPRPVDRVAPTYPARARARGATGFVTLSVLVGADGRVRDVRVLQADPPDTFEEAAMTAVRAWTFQPGRYQGEAVDVRVEQTLRFGLE
jgi:protein TonB